MRVAHFIQRYPPALGGSEAYFARLSRYLVDASDEVTVFTTTALDLKAFWSPKGECLSAGVVTEGGVEVRRYRLLRWPARRWFLKPLSLVPYCPWQRLTLPCNPIALGMWNDARKMDRRFDIVHATTFPYAFPMSCGLKMARRLKVPFVITPFLHLGDPLDPRDPVRRSYTTPALLSLVRAADAVFVQTPSERDTLASFGIHADKLILLGMGVEPDECTGGNRERARTQWHASADEVIVGHLANQSREKGTVELLQAAELLWMRGIKFRIVLAGPEMPSFQRYWRSYQPLGQVNQLGIVDDTTKRDFFAGIDVFALPSRSDSFGLVLLEAWANHVANIGYRAGGIADVIKDGEDGLLVRCGDLAGLAEGIQRLVIDCARRKRLGECGFQRVGRDFCWSDKLQKVREVYQELKPGMDTLV